MAARHFKYTYNSEIPPKTVLSRMLTANIDDSYTDNSINSRIDLNIERNRIYFSRRKELKYLMKSVNSHIDNNSQSLFLTLYYMDLIFTHKDLEKVFYSHFMVWNNYTSFNDLQMNNYALLSLACLVIASKFNENDPHVPTMSSYIRLLYEYSKKKYIFNLDSLYMAEVVVVKLLKYKLNYYTIYHYLIFFFTHGIVFKKTIENSKIFKKYSERKILEKIYIQAREILDGVIDPQKYFNLYFGKDNYIIVVEILLWSIEHIMNIKIKDDENIFKLVFNINVDENQHKEIYGIIEQIYRYIKKKNNNFGNTSTRIAALNSNTNNNNNSSKPPESISSSTRPKNTEIDFKFIEHKPSVPSTAYSNVKSSYSIPSSISKPEKDFQYYNGLIQNELDTFNSNYPYKVPRPYHIPHQSSMVKHESWAPQSTIKYGPNNRVYLTSNKNLTTSYKLNSKDNNDNALQNIVNPQEINIKSFDIEKEPIDSDKLHYNKLNHNLNVIDTIENKSRKIILINEPNKNRKKSLSCSKNIFNVPYDCQTRPSASLKNNIEAKLKLEDNYKKVNEINHPRELNNYYNNFTPNSSKNLVEYSIKQENEKKPFKNFQPIINEYYPAKSINGNYLSDKFVTKFLDEGQLINKPKSVLPGKAINQNLKLEPQDNKRGSTNKYYYDSRIKNKITNSYNKTNTIIINNNIHINTFIDKNNININPKNSNKSKTSKNVILFNGPSEKKVNKIYDDTNFENKFKNIRNKQKNISEIKNGRSKINKSSIVFSHKLDNNSENIIKDF